MQEKYINVNNLKVSEKLLNFVNDELLKDTEISPDSFWEGFDKVVHELAPKNKELLDIRDQLQKKIDEYKKFLLKIGYLKEEGSDFKIETNNIDEEISSIAGPQLVVPIMNARYALNAANARWMSLYDSLYGTDTIKPIDTSKNVYDASRG